MESRYRRNVGAVYSLKYHLVWCPKYRRPVLVEDVAVRLAELLEEKAVELNVRIHTLRVMSDHVHLFIESDPVLCVAELVNRFKGYTSRVMRSEFPSLKSRLPTLWSRSYYAGTVGSVSDAVVTRYIENQKGK